MDVLFRYYPIDKKYSSNKGLAERLIRKNLEKEGWVVFRGGFLHAPRLMDLYPNVRKKYEKLKNMMDIKDLEYLQFLSRVHHGMPDFFCYRKGEKKFVECKLGHEQLSNVQKRCIKILKLKGYSVEVQKAVFSCTKVREAMVDIYTNEKDVIAKQERLKIKYRKS